MQSGTLAEYDEPEAEEEEERREGGGEAGGGGGDDGGKRRRRGGSVVILQFLKILMVGGKGGSLFIWGSAGSLGAFQALTFNWSPVRSLDFAHHLDIVINFH